MTSAELRARHRRTEGRLRITAAFCLLFSFIYLYRVLVGRELISVAPFFLYLSGGALLPEARKLIPGFHLIDRSFQLRARTDRQRELYDVILPMVAMLLTSTN